LWRSGPSAFDSLCRIVPARRRTSRSIGAATAAFLLLLAAACGKPPELTREAAADLIVRSPAFEGPWDPGIRVTDSEKTAAAPDAQRRLLRVESVALKEDGPWGIAGSTGTAVFAWRWQNGPLAGFDYRSRVKLHSSRGVWKVYNDQLQEELWRAERGEE
jgi:hypothetical protein